MGERRPIITDPDHLAEAAGSAYVCVRPGGAVAEAFDAMQARLRDVVREDRASWPAAHLTLKGFGTRAGPLDAAAERTISPVVERWANETPPLELAIEGVEVFEDDRIPVVRIQRSHQLGDALTSFRSAASTVGLPGDEDAIPTEDWIFHLSLVYYDGERWPLVDAAAREVELPSVSCIANEVELVGFDGGPERLLGRFPLLGAP